MEENQTIIDDIRKLYREKIGRKKGVIIRSYERMEVGIRTYNFDVLSKDGLHLGYWTDPKPKYSDRTIISRMVDSENCQEWDTLDYDQLKECQEFFRHYS